MKNLSKTKSPLIKIILIGESEVGKSSIISTFIVIRILIIRIKNLLKKVLKNLWELTQQLKI